MTAREMQIEFERQVQVMDPSLAFEEKLDSDTIFSFLNISQDRYLLMRYTQRDSLENAPQNVKRNLDSIKNLIVQSTISNLNEVTPTSHSAKLPTDYFLYITSECNVTGTVKQYEEPETVINKLITHDEKEEVMTTMYNTPILYTPAILLEGTDTNSGIIYVYTDIYTKIKDLTITYIRKPNKINIDSNCELSEDTHFEIVKLAVEIFVNEARYRLTKNTLDNQNQQ